MRATIAVFTLFIGMASADSDAIWFPIVMMGIGLILIILEAIDEKRNSSNTGRHNRNSRGWR